MKNILFMCVGIGLLVLILSRVEMSRLLGILQEADMLLFSFAVVFTLFQIMLSTARWHVLLKFKRIYIPAWTLLKTFLIGSFISSFLPGRYSGDLYRVYIAKKYSDRGAESLAATMVERLSGLTILVLFGLIASFFSSSMGSSIQLTRSIQIICVGILLVISVVFLEKPYTRVFAWLKKKRVSFLLDKIERVHRAIVDYRTSPRLIGQVVFLSILFYILHYLIIYCAALSVGAQLSLLYLAFVVPIVCLVEALPISINGLGVREGAIVFFLTNAGVALDVSVATSLLVLATRLISSIMGGLIFIGGQIELKELQKEIPVSQ